MAGVTIDHLVATTAFIAATLLFVGLFTQTLQTAVLYQQNRHIAIRASNLLDSILLSPGYPYRWGETNDTLSCFGLQQPGATDYVLSPFALMRLTSATRDVVEYPRGSGILYNNVTTGSNGYLLIPIHDSVTYDTASRLLGVNETYGFQLSITPIVDIDISVNQSNPLTLKVEASGPGFPLSRASITYYLFRVIKTGLELLSGTTQTNSIGTAYLNFSFDGNSETYIIVVYARLSGLFGVGQFTHRTFTQGSGVIPFVVDYEKAKVFLAHSWDVQDQGTPVPDYKCNATFFALTDTFNFVEWPIANSTFHLNYGSKNYEITTLPIAFPGFMIVSYKSGNEVGMNLMPWGIGSLETSVTFGGDPANNAWTATDIRYVIVGQMTYQAKITCWSLKGYQVWNPSGGW